MTDKLKQPGELITFRTAFIVEELYPVILGIRIVVVIEVLEAVCASTVGAFGVGKVTEVEGIAILDAAELEPTEFVTVTTHVKNALAKSDNVSLVIV